MAPGKPRVGTLIRSLDSRDTDQEEVWTYPALCARKFLVLFRSILMKRIGLGSYGGCRVHAGARRAGSVRPGPRAGGDKASCPRSGSEA